VATPPRGDEYAVMIEPLSINPVAPPGLQQLSKMTAAARGGFSLRGNDR
jgi:hypothetical protein